MDRQELSILDLDGLAAQLDMNAGMGIEGICIGEKGIADLAPAGKPTVNGFFTKRQADSRKRYPITVYYSGLGGGTATLGSITAEAGIIDSDENYSGWYEKAALVTCLPVQLRDGRIIPPCRVSVSFEKDSDYSPIDFRREDRRRVLWIGSIRWDLSAVLPTAWFRGMSAEEYDRRLARSQPQAGSPEYSLPEANRS